MANTTPYLGLKTIDRATESKDKLVGEWIDDINDANHSNAVIIDTAAMESAKIILSATEPQNMSINTYWLKELGNEVEPNL